MIEDAVLKMGKGEKTLPVEKEIILNLLTEATLPDEYIGSMNQRLDAYKTISSCKTEEELWDVRSSLEDRYGKMPEETVHLFYTMQIRMLAAEMHLLQLNQSYDELDLAFSDDFAPDHESLLKFLANSEFKPVLAPDSRITVALPHSTPVEILRFLQFFKKEIFSRKKA